MKVDIDINPSYKEVSIVIKALIMNQTVTAIVDKLITDQTKKRQPISGKLEE